MSAVTDIEQLVLRERQGRDRGRWERMRSAWEPDARVRVSWLNDTAEAFVEGSIAMSQAGTLATHRLSPAVIDVVGDRAIVEVPAVIETRALVGGAAVDLASRVRLLYRAKRRETGWLLHAMTCVYQSDGIVPVVPGTNPELHADGDRDYRSSYRWLATILEAAGHPIADDLPGDDRPAGVTAIEREEQAWLDEETAGALPAGEPRSEATA